MGGWEVGRPTVLLVCGSLVYYHCAYRQSSLLSLVADVFIVLLCSLAILGMLFRQMNISVPVDPLEWQISQDTANSIAACMANTIGAAESVLRVAATGHDRRLFFKVLRVVVKSFLPNGLSLCLAHQAIGYNAISNSKIIPAMSKGVLGERRLSSLAQVASCADSAWHWFWQSCKTRAELRRFDVLAIMLAEVT
ncbi:hypothetical protein Taro_030376 [Colocasia esculenta]|uniref:Reticulon domain-containing protein n=1 Tax=Colocasia esculenta TaxID=4460 RepID=A0A843VNZ1_COLES|nr:hypothetical protein [Colocasia esculenta]